MEENEIPIACRPQALTPQERAREGELLQEHLASVRQVREQEDGPSSTFRTRCCLTEWLSWLVWSTAAAPS